jgi:kinesin family protein 5
MAPQVRLEQRGEGWYVEELTWHTCATPEAMMEIFEAGRKQLKYAETHMNKHSSRSHAVMQFKVNVP